MVPEDAVGPLFKVINERMQASADADLKEQGLTFAQSQVIVYLIEHAGRALQKEIETSLKVSHPTVSGLVSRLEKNGFVRTWVAEDDRRSLRTRHTMPVIACVPPCANAIESCSPALMNASRRSSSACSGESTPTSANNKQ